MRRGYDLLPACCCASRAACPSLRRAAGVGSSPATWIRRIVVEGNQRIEPSTVESYLAIRPGEAFDPQKARRVAQEPVRDRAVRRRGDRAPGRRAGGQGGREPDHQPHRLRGQQAARRRRRSRPRSSCGRASSIPAPRVQNAVNRILELYRRNGRYAAKVEPKIIELDQNRVDLVFEINEGPITGVGGISFIGNEQFSDSTLRGVIQTKESGLVSLPRAPTTPTIPTGCTFDQELLRRFYLARGYADFQVVSAIAELTPDGKEFFITFTVEEGPQYKFGDDRRSRRTLKDLTHRAAASAWSDARRRDVYNADLIETTDPGADRRGRPAGLCVRRDRAAC